MPEVNEVAAQRIIAQEEAAIATGFSPAQPWFAAGTRLIEVGQNNYKQSRLDYDSMPGAREALGGLIETIQSEQRIDYDVGAQELHMDEEGNLLWADRGFKLTPESFTKLVNLTLPDRYPNPTSYWKALPPDRRAKAVNDAFIHSANTMKLRTRNVGDIREVFAVVSQRYAAVDGDLIAHRLMQSLDSDTKTSIIYRGTRSTMNFLWHSTIAPEDVGVGEIYRAGQQFTTDDDGTERIRGQAKLSRAICINLTTVDANQNTFARVHRGDVERILAAIEVGWDQGMERIQWFLRAWNDRSNLDIRVLLNERMTTPATYEPFNPITPLPIAEAIFAHKNWRILGVSPNSVAQAIEAAWFAEAPNWTVTGFSNAISRAAHESNWPRPEIAEELEVAAGRIVTTVPLSIPWGVAEENV